MGSELDDLYVSVENRMEAEQWQGAKLAGKYIYILFEGQFSEEAGQQSANWVTHNIKELKNFSLVFDTRNITGYESGARKAWEEALFSERKRIEELVLLANSTVAMMGATMFGLVMGIKVRRIQTLKEL